jgi:hypothetical protein
LPWYEIEVVVFANKDQLGLDTETWPEVANGNDYTNSIILGFPHANPVSRIQTPKIPDIQVMNPDGSVQPVAAVEPVAPPPEAYAFLDASEMKFTDLVSRLKASSKYELLLHIGWRQPTDSTEKSLPVYVYNGMDDPSLANAVDDLTTQSMQNSTAMPVSQNSRFMQQAGNSMMNRDNGPVGPNYQRLYGTIRLSVSRYLHVEPDLHFRAPVIQQEYVLEQPDSSFFSSSAELVERLIERKVILDFSLHESRRMRSKEVHYYDHPMFGMIVVVTPIKLPGE